MTATGPGMLVDAAHQNAKETLAELRDLARGIHPPVLDRGLGAALSSLAETSAVPVRLARQQRAAAFAGHRGHRLLLRGGTAGQRGQAQRGEPGHDQRHRPGRAAADDRDRRRDRRRAAWPRGAGSPGCSTGCRRWTGGWTCRQPARRPDRHHDRAAGARLMAAAALRIVIAEDAAIMRDGLTQTLTRRGHDVVAAVADAERAAAGGRRAPARRGHHRRADAARPYR